MGSWDAASMIVSLLYRATRALLSVPAVPLPGTSPRTPNCW
ncbi:hypothetical protein [Kutzneria sp. NPDC051319]